MGVLFQLAQNAALLQLHVEALQRAIDRLVRLDGNVNQNSSDASEASIMARPAGEMLNG